MVANAGYLTWATIWNTLQNGELDLNDDNLMDEAEAREIANQATREAEALIHTIYEDYFLTLASPNLSLVQGADEIALPTGSYAMKVRGIIYTNGSIIYEMVRIREWVKFLAFRLLRISPNSATRYRYFIINTTVGSPKIKISPPAQESGAYLETWFLRRAGEMTTGTDICDIPEFVQFIYDSVRVKLYEKEGNPMLEKAVADKAATRQLMIDTLTEMIPDHDNKIEADMSYYMEHT